LLTWTRTHARRTQDDSDHRLALSLENVDKKGFTLNVGTWLETKVWSLEVTWIAFDNSFLSGTKGTRARPALRAPTPDMASKTRNFAHTHTGLQIASGRWPFKRTTPGYVLHEGTGNRSVKQHITYPRKFAGSGLRLSHHARLLCVCVCVVRAI
jgi:hypothetical protein